ncbi:MAG: ABC transporter permease [Crocinitomicaceae bacterium]|nr:ABC transporter permease [Crocinitomicaceae bacterium]|tara:strand:+ start:10492 stop:11271 length:780 start_codon:yes stop_codon:yes gene_type:complete
MLSVFKYCLFDLLRSRWSIVYTLFYLLSSASLLYFSNSATNAVASLMNIVLFITPLVSLLLGVIYFYQNRDFAELLLAQPIRRSQYFYGNYFGLSLSLVINLLVGFGLPMLFIGNGLQILQELSIVLLAGVMLTLIFSALALLITLRNENRVLGFGYAIVVWLFFAVIYDGLFLILLLWFNDYPLEKFAMIGTVLNPMDLSRVMILLKLDLSALMGFTGASFRQFFGSTAGFFVSLSSALIWITLPLYLLIRKGNTKDF